MNIKKSVKIISIVFGIWVGLNILVYCGFGLFGTIKVDYRCDHNNDIMQLLYDNKEKIEEEAKADLDPSDMVYMAYNPQLHREGKIITTSFIDDNGKIVSVEGNRVWNGIYKWKCSAEKET